MKLVNSKIALEFDDLVRGGVNVETLRKASYRDSKNWPFFKDNSDSRKLLIYWQDIEDRYKNQIQAALGDPEELINYETLVPFLSCPKRDALFLSKYTDENGQFLTPAQLSKYTTACAYLNLLDSTKSQYSQLGFTKRAEFEAAIICLIKANQVELPTHPKSLLRKLKSYRELGAMALISKKIGNNNTVVLDSLQKTWLISAYADHRKPSVEQVYNIYLVECAERGWKAASLRRVREVLSDSSIKQIVDIERDPKLWKDRFGFTIKTRKPDVPCALWESDGTKLNLFYRNETGKLMADLQMYIVADIASEAIIGYSFGKSENADLVKKAFRMGLQRSKLLPKQVRYDNGGAHRSAEVSSFIDNLADVNFRSTAYSGQSKYIEGIIGRFQTKHLRLFHNFTGMNITAKSDNSRLNTSYIKSNPHLVPDLPTCIKNAVEALEAWNHSVIKGGLTRIEYFKRNAEGRQLTEQDQVLLMYEPREALTYRKDGLELICAGKKLHYDVYNGDVPDLDFHAENVGRKFAIRWNPEETDHIYLLDQDSNRIIARAERITEMAGSLYDYTEGSRSAINKRLAMKKDQAQRAFDKVYAAKDEFQVELSHSRSYKDALSRAEAEYLSQSIEDSAPMPPKAIKKKQDIMLPEDFQEGRILDDLDEL